MSKKVSKNVTKGTKNVRERESCLKVTKTAFLFFLSHFITFCGLLRLSMVLYGLLMVKYGLLWQNIDSIQFLSFFLAVIVDPNSFRLVCSYFENVLNKEKQQSLFKDL